MGLSLFSNIKFPGEYIFNCDQCGENTDVTLNRGEILDVYCNNYLCRKYLTQIRCDSFCETNVESIVRHMGLLEKRFF